MYRNEESSSDDYANYITNYFSDGDDNLNDCCLCCETDIHAVKAPIHIICLLLNIVIPGSGTILSAFTCLHAVRDDVVSKESGHAAVLWGTVCDGVMQMLLTVFIFGYIWSVVVGCNIYSKSIKS